MLIKEQRDIENSQFLTLFNAYYQNAFQVIYVISLCEPRLVRKRIKLHSIHCIGYK